MADGGLLEKLKEHVKKVRCDFGLPEAEPSMLISDAALQHSNHSILEAAHIWVEDIPKKVPCSDKAKILHKLIKEKSPNFCDFLCFIWKYLFLFITVHTLIEFF